MPTDAISGTDTLLMCPGPPIWLLPSFGDDRYQYQVAHPQYGEVGGTFDTQLQLFWQ